MNDPTQHGLPPFPTPRPGARPARFAVTRRGFLVLGATTAATLALDGLPSSPATATAAPSAAWFARPRREVRPMVRWWWPDAHVDPAEIRREVDQLADAGFGGAEIAAVHHSIRDKSVLDPAGHGWGTPAWNTAVEAALDQAARRGLTIDLTIGPAWPAAIPTITPAGPASAKELAHGSVTVPAGTTYSGPVPPPSSPPANPAASCCSSRRPGSTPPTRPATRPASTPPPSGPSPPRTGRRSPGPPPPTATGCSSPTGNAAPASAPSRARTPPPRRTSWTTSAAPAPRR
ncbi:glycosyl hydrolase [Nonomuraea rubra]|uniref:glycosyl hydrolase n=1 Tax=Nonomuraea rubra TaxID=46180 RepID=UPI0036094812